MSWSLALGFAVSSETPDQERPTGDDSTTDSATHQAVTALCSQYLRTGGNELATSAILMPMADPKEVIAQTPTPVNPKGFNPHCKLPYGLTVGHVHSAMDEFVKFLQLVNGSLVPKGTPRLESILMPANFSSIVGEFAKASIPKFCKGLSANAYHNGHPDLIPKGKFPGDSCQHGEEGIEIKGSRYLRGWQGHNAEACWLMVFSFESNRPVDVAEGIAPMPFRFLQVAGAQLTKEDWVFAGRSITSRRTITATVTPGGYEKMMANWIYKA